MGLFFLSWSLLTGNMMRLSLVQGNLFSPNTIKWQCWDNAFAKNRSLKINPLLPFGGDYKYSNINKPLVSMWSLTSFSLSAWTLGYLGPLLWSHIWSFLLLVASYLKCESRRLGKTNLKPVLLLFWWKHLKVFLLLFPCKAYSLCLLLLEVDILEMNFWVCFSIVSLS